MRFFLPAYGQFDNSGLDRGSIVATSAEANGQNGNNGDRNENTIQDASSFELRGLIGSEIASVNNVRQDETNEESGEYIATGRWRIVVTENSLDRFFANLTIAPIGGGESRIIIIEDEGPFYAIVRSNNGSTMKSNMTAIIYPNSNNLTRTTAAAELEIRGDNVVRIIVDKDTGSQSSQLQLPPQLQILSLLNGRSLYGTVHATDLG